MKTRFESMNFLTNVLTLVFITLGIQGITFELRPDEMIAEILAKNWEYIGNIFLPAITGLGFKIVQKVKDGTWVWRDVIKSTNFWTQVITVISGLLAFIGIMLPESAPQDITAAIFSGSVVALITAIIANVLTPLWHFFKDGVARKKVTT